MELQWFATTCHGLQKVTSSQAAGYNVKRMSNHRWQAKRNDSERLMTQRCVVATVTSMPSEMSLLEAGAGKLILTSD
jgi:hypothetical protein